MKAKTFNKMIEVIKPDAIRGFNGKQTLSLIPLEWKWSWGFSRPTIAVSADALDKRCGLDTQILMFTVNGYIHKGFVMICLNGADLFNVYFFSRMGNLKKEKRDLYFDQLAEVLDIEIERQKDYVQ